MSQSSNQFCYALSPTLIVVGLSATVEVGPISYQNGSFFKIQGGAGSLAIVSGQSAIASSGYLVGNTEIVDVPGPAKFFLAATGATMTVGLCFRRSAGQSLFP